MSDEQTEQDNDELVEYLFTDSGGGDNYIIVDTELAAAKAKVGVRVSRHTGGAYADKREVIKSELARIAAAKVATGESDCCDAAMRERLAVDAVSRQTVLDWLARRCDYGPPCGQCTYCAVALNISQMPTLANVEAAAEAKYSYPPTCSGERVSAG